MLQVAANNPYLPVQPTAPATPLAQTAALHVAYYDVPPSVSNAQVNNNASGNNGALLTAAGTASAASAADAFPQFLNPQPLGAGAQAPFLAQLLGQYVPPEIENAFQGVLDGYNKTFLERGLVKYMPSFANYPRSDPSSAFAQQVRQEAPKANVAQAALPQAAAVVAAAQPAPAPKPAATTPAKPQSRETEKGAAAPQAVRAYTAVAVRNNAPVSAHDVESA